LFGLTFEKLLLFVDICLTDRRGQAERTFHNDTKRRLTHDLEPTRRFHIRAFSNLGDFAPEIHGEPHVRIDFAYTDFESAFKVVIRGLLAERLNSNPWPGKVAVAKVFCEGAPARIAQTVCERIAKFSTVFQNLLNERFFVYFLAEAVSAQRYSQKTAIFDEFFRRCRICDVFTKIINIADHGRRVLKDFELAVRAVVEDFPAEISA
jgi:hypothetical protein